MTLPHIIQSTGWYFPESGGGTEVYVDGLARALQKRGYDIEIIAAQRERPCEPYVYNGIPVSRYPVDAACQMSQIRSEEPHPGFESFQKLLKNKALGIYHQHSITYGNDIHHLRYAKMLGYRTALTFHLPTAFCVRQTMMENGEKPCDGKVETSRCAYCWGLDRNVPHWAAWFFSKLPLGISQSGLKYLPASSLTTSFSRRYLVKAFYERFKELITLTDKVIAVCQWMYDALAANGVPTDKLEISRQGIVDPDSYRKSEPSMHRPLRFLFLGRWHHFKGLDILIEGFRKIPAHLPFELTLYGTGSDEAALAYKQKIEKLINGNPNIKVAPTLTRNQLPTVISEHDALVVPSRWLESGPYVILEAHAAGIAVIASPLGGNVELLKDGQNGLLVDANTPEGWERMITHILLNPGTLKQVKGAQTSVRTIHDAADDMERIYKQLMADATRKK